MIQLSIKLSVLGIMCGHPIVGILLLPFLGGFGKHNLGIILASLTYITVAELRND